LESVDSNANGFIDFTEFVQATISREKVITQEKLGLAFRMLDTDNSGKISVKELKEHFGGNKHADSTFKDMIRDIDGDDDGEISLEEFKATMI